jgi:hypothetical protein
MVESVGGDYNLFEEFPCKAASTSMLKLEESLQCISLANIWE